MAVCRQYQISHSHFLGGPARWTESDQDKALDYEQLLAVTCNGCGTRLDEWEDDQFAYVGHHLRCPGCETIEQERENVPEGQRGVHVSLLPRALAEQQAELDAEADRQRRARTDPEG